MQILLNKAPTRSRHGRKRKWNHGNELRRAGGVTWSAAGDAPGTGAAGRGGVAEAAVAIGAVVERTAERGRHRPAGVGSGSLSPPARGGNRGDAAAEEADAHADAAAVFLARG